MSRVRAAASLVRIGCERSVVGFSHGHQCSYRTRSVMLLAHSANAGTANSGRPTARCRSDTSITPISRCGKRCAYLRMLPYTAGGVAVVGRLQAFAHQRGGDAVLQVDAVGHFGGLAGDDGVDVRHLCHVVDEGLQFQSGRLADAGHQRIGQQLGLVEFLQRAMRVFPRTRAGKGDRRVRRVEAEQQVGAEAQEGDHARVDVLAVRPVHPVVQVHLDFVVGEAVGQRCRHGVGHAAVALAVAGREDHPAVRHLVFAQAAVENQLVGRGRHGRRRRGDLVEKQDARRAVAFGIRQHRGNRPFDQLAVAERNAAQVGRLHLRQADVDQRHAVLLRNLGDDLRLADARRAPQHHRRVMAVGGTFEFTVEDGFDVGGTHGLCNNAE